jgi:hypothetical protein
MRSTPQVWTLPFTDKPILDFEANASSVEIVPLGPGESPRIEARREGAQLDVKQVGQMVVVRLIGAGMDNPWGGNPFEHRRGAIAEEIVRGIATAVLNSRRFGGAYTLHVPAHVQARITCNMGEVELHNLAGCDVGVFTNMGSLNVDECRGRFNLKAKAGRILCRRVGGSIDVESGMGEAMLDLVALDEGVHKVMSTMGSVKVDLKPGLDVKVESRTVMGSTRTRYPSRPDGKAVLKLEAELGSVRVREGPPYKDPRHGDWPDWRTFWKESAPPAVSTSPAAPSGGELRKILDLVQQKKVSPEEAERLISALHGN